MQLFTDPGRSPHAVEETYRESRWRNVSPADLAKYGYWVASTWPADALALMGGRADDGVTPADHDLYAAMLGKRAVQVRVDGANWMNLAEDPGSFAINRERPITDMSPQAVQDEWERSQQSALGILVTRPGDVAAEVRKEWGVSSIFGVPGEIVRRMLAPLIVPAIIIGILILIWKLPNWSKKGAAHGA